MAFLDTLKSWWDSVKKLWNDLTGGTPETTATTPTTTTTTTPNTPTTDTVSQAIWNAWTVLPNIQTAETLNQLANSESQSSSNPTNNITATTISNPSDYYDYNALNQENVKKALEEREGWRDESIWDSLINTAKSVSSWLDRYTRWTSVNDEYNKNRKVTYVWYDKDSDDVYSLELWTDYYSDNWNTITTQQAFEKAIQKYQATVDAYGWEDAPVEVQAEAFDQLYKDTKWMFVARWEDWYESTDGYTKRKNSFSQDELDLLEKNNVKKWKYEPTPTQFKTYIKNLWLNYDLSESLQNKYNLKDDDALDLDNSQKWRAQEIFMNKVMNWVMDEAKNNLKWTALQTFIWQAYTAWINDFERAWEASLWTYEAAAVLREKLKQWLSLTPEERAVIESANKLDDMFNRLADSRNDFILEHASKDYVWDDGKIYEARDIFSDWRTLWEVMSQPVLTAAWMWWDENTSWIDAFQRVGNDALYNYNKNVGSAFWDVWEMTQHYLWKGWSFLSELWQTAIRWASTLYNYYTDASVWNVSSLMARAKWEKAGSKTWEYLNQDATIWQLINTEEEWMLADMLWQDAQRQVRKFLRYWWEYWPEVVGNFIPDMLLVEAWWWTLARHLPTFARALSKWAKALDFTNAVEKIKWADYIRKAIGWIRWFEEWAEALVKAADTPSWLKYSWERALKLIKDWIIDQAIDAQLSIYDTEAYSDTSFWLSLWWTVLTEIIPWLYKTWAFTQLRNIALWNYINKGTAWDAIEFLSKPENQSILENSIKRYWKNWALTFEDFRRIAYNLEDLSDFLKNQYNKMPATQKLAATKWTKDLAYKLMNQVYDINSNSVLGRNLRAIISKEGTSLADIFKFIWWIPWDVTIWPWRSVIKLKNADWTVKNVLGIEWWNISTYNQKLDMLFDWWLATKLENWFTLNDINAINSLSDYKDVDTSMFTLGDDWKYFLTEEWVHRLWITTMDMPIAWQANEIAKAEAWEVSSRFQNVMKRVRNSRRNLTDPTIDAIASSGTYQDVREKVADIVC